MRLPTGSCANGLSGSSTMTISVDVSIHTVAGRSMTWIEKASHAGRSAQCQGKETWSTAAAALRVLRKMRRRKQDANGLAAYRCRHCSGWHIGNLWNDAFGRDTWRSSTRSAGLARAREFGMERREGVNHAVA